MKMNLKVSIRKNGTVGERAVPNLDGKAGVSRVGIVISIGGMIKVGTKATRIEIGPNLKKEVNLIMRIGSMTLTLEITTPEAETWPLPDLRNTQWNRSLMITPMSDRRTHKQLQHLIILTS